MKNHIRLFTTVLVMAGLLSGCAAEASPPPASPESIPALSGTQGAAHFDDGYVQIGSGPKTVDLFVDPMCPYCKLFEETSGELLFKEAASGGLTLRVHPLATLNRLSQGTNYSTRASATLVAVASESPDSAEKFLRALYDQQPAENTSGLTNAQLEAMVSVSGATPVAADKMASYEAWVNAHTQLALTGPLKATTEIPGIAHVPTVVVNGSVFPGNSNESAAFATFYAAQ
ncbi:thioredoxin domain-containing protein [Agreia pratensis]|uniref:DsbA family protein n=1 Tax=Agreia pratensis TaxID=150121 RepID=UPI00188AB5E0|nr:thioredoxin domain-containing protein [Agreia pratensis]MBF4636298.1 thioredoxin domain-containing protein [Agreia pratensis]